MSFGVVYAEANQGVRGKGIFEFQFQQDLNKALDKVDGAEHKARKLRPLYVGSRWLLQNQSGTDPHKWNRSGVVIKVLDQFLVRIDCSRKLTQKVKGF